MTHLRTYLEQHASLAPESLDAALRRQQIYGGSLDTVLLELELVDAWTLNELLRQACGLPTASIDLLDPTFSRPWSVIPSELIEIGWAIPLRADAQQIIVGVHPDLPNERLGRLHREVPNVRPLVTPECCIEQIAAQRLSPVVPQRYAVLFAAYVQSLRVHPSETEIRVSFTGRPPQARPRPVALGFSPPGTPLGLDMTTNLSDDNDATGRAPSAQDTQAKFETPDALDPSPVTASRQATEQLPLPSAVQSGSQPERPSAPEPVASEPSNPTPLRVAVSPQDEPLTERDASRPIVTSVDRLSPDIDGDEPLPAGIPTFSPSDTSGIVDSEPARRDETRPLRATQPAIHHHAPPAAIPPVRFTARGTALSPSDRERVQIDEASLTEQLDRARQTLRDATNRSAVIEGIAAAAAVITHRIALFSIDGHTLDRISGVGSVRGSIDRIALLPDAPLSAILDQRIWLGETTDPTLRAAVGVDRKIPCLTHRIDVAGHPIIVLYADHQGREFLPFEASALRDLSLEAGEIFHRVDGSSPQLDAAPLAPPPVFAGHDEAVSTWNDALARADSASLPLADDLGFSIPPMLTEDSARRATSQLPSPSANGIPMPAGLTSVESSGIIPLSTPLGGSELPTARGNIHFEPEDLSPTQHAGHDVEIRRIDASLLSLAKGELDVSAFAELGELGLERLAAHFPGPLEVLRRDLRALPPPSAHGPYVRAAIALGRYFIPHLHRLFDHDDADVRFYAAFVFQELRDPGTMPALALLAFDQSADVRVISMRVLETYSRHSGFSAAIAGIRLDLEGHDPSRQLHAARAVGTLRDTKAIPRLIELLAHHDRFVQEASLESLCSITGQQFGLKPHRWRNWHHDNHERHRVEWIIDSLRHRDPPVRRWAHDELVRVTGHRVPFSPLGDRQSRETAAKAWTEWWNNRSEAQTGSRR